MQFDARAAKLLTAGPHFTISDCPGLRLAATSARRSWICHYKSPLDGRMRQTKIGGWTVMSLAAATVEWERLRGERSAGGARLLASLAPLYWLNCDAACPEAVERGQVNSCAVGADCRVGQQPEKRAYGDCEDAHAATCCLSSARLARKRWFFAIIFGLLT